MGFSPCFTCEFSCSLQVDSVRIKLSLLDTQSYPWGIELIVDVLKKKNTLELVSELYQVNTHSYRAVCMGE